MPLQVDAQQIGNTVNTTAAFGRTRLSTILELIPLHFHDAPGAQSLV